MESKLPLHLLDRIFEPLGGCLTPEVAKRIMELRADPATQSRVDELAEKCNEGLLSDDERSEYDAYVVAGRLIAILQVKSRRLISGQSAA
jgi:hypothetical protein